MPSLKVTRMSFSLYTVTKSTRLDHSRSSNSVIGSCIFTVWRNCSSSFLRSALSATINLIELCLDRLITADQPVITLCILVLVKGDTGVLRNAPLYQARCTVPASVSPPESASTSSICTS